MKHRRPVCTWAAATVLFAAATGHAVITLERVPRSLEEVYLQVVGENSTTNKAGPQ